MATSRATPPRRPKATRATTGIGKLSAEVNDLKLRVGQLEALVDTARVRQQQAAAQRLAQNPEQMAALQALLEMAKATGEPAGNPPTQWQPS